MVSSGQSMRPVDAFLAAVVDGAVTFDERGSIVGFNRASEAIFGYDAGEIVGRNVTELLPDPYRTEFARDFAKHLRDGRSEIVGGKHQLEGRRKDGSVFPLELAVGEGQLDGERLFIGIVHDMTERKRAEQALRRSEERFELAVAGSRDGLWDWDIVTDEVYYGPQYRALLGFDETDYPGVGDSFRRQLHPADRERVFAAFVRHLRDREPFDEEFRHRCRDGSLRHFRARGQALWDATGRAVRMAGSITDITERKDFERTLAEARDAAEAASRAKSRFLANMSHELRTPLNSVIGFSNVLIKNKTGNLRVDDLVFLTRIRDNGLHLLSLIDEVLEISKIEAGRIRLELEPVRADELVREVLTGLQGNALEKSITLELVAPERIETIPADATRLKQVLINLLGNALKFTERGGITVRVRTVAGSDRPRRIDVVDTGVGIPADRMESIFEAFEQADASTTRRFGGTGLGLAISRAFCRAMGFDLLAESAVGRGSTFTIVFDPVAEFARAKTEGLTGGSRTGR